MNREMIGMLRTGQLHTCMERHDTTTDAVEYVAIKRMVLW